ncbi:ATP-dependent helicase [Aliarcobacter butzleri]|uniref:ATP-dependent helicase n=1 Tax=Aliarcobacter butzleri TaxID=28197 RepID=UPI003AF60E8A
MNIKLNKEQKEASEILNNNLQIIACAGSGKTLVISLRIINLLKKGINPNEIVAFTFTEKAAAELKHRVFELAKNEPAITTIGLAEMYIGTIHSWCLTKLKDNAITYQKYEILDDIKLKLFVDRAYIKAGMKNLGMRCYIDTNIFINLMSLVRETQFKEGIILAENLEKSRIMYENYLEENNYLDFTMILTKFLEEIKNKSSRLYKYINNDIKYLIVDEYQDVNDIQETIINEIYKSDCNICVVGDDDQTIYHWRGSNIKNILNFSKNYKDVRSVTLDKNYRSSEAIVDVATKIIEEIKENRLAKKMISASHQEFEEADLIKNNFENQKEEVEYIVNTIKNVRGVEFLDKKGNDSRGLDYSDIVILLRTWNVADVFAEGLKDANIPYVVAGVTKLFEQDEIKASVNIFKYLSGQILKNDLEESWLKLSEKIEINKLLQAIDYLDSYDDIKEDTWYEYLILQQVFRTYLDKLEVSEKTFSYLENEHGMEKGEIVFYNLGKFSQIIQDFETIHFRDNPIKKLDNFINFLHYTAADYYPEGWLNQNLVTPNAVTIMTIHQSKGLEYPVVFIPGMNRNYFPAKKPGGKNIWHFIDKDIIEKERYEGNEDDERRLFYVAITRAKKFLFITRSPKLTKNNLYNKESLFYSDLRKSEFIFQSTTDYFDRKHTLPKSEKKINNIILNFTLLESYFECPYKFKFDVLYGFNEPLSPRIGYGKSIHDSLMEIHKRSMENDIPEIKEMDEILDRHLSFPYAIESTKQTMKKKAREAIIKYYNNNRKDFNKIQYTEKDIELDFGNGIIINGRIDLIKKSQLNGKEKTYIIDFKSKFDPNKDKIDFKQLQIYAIGYKRLTNKMADFIQIYDFEKGEAEPKQLLVNELNEIEKEVISAATNIKNNKFEQKCNDKNCICQFH